MTYLGVTITATRKCLVLLRVRCPHLVSGAGSLFVLIAYLAVLEIWAVGYPAAAGSYTCDFSQDEAASQALANPGSGLIPRTGAGRYTVAVGADGHIALQDLRAGVQHVFAAGQSPTVTPDGRYVVFLSRDGLVPGGGRGWQVVLYDRVQLRYEQISDPGGEQGQRASAYSVPSISADGRFVAFVASQDSLGQAYLRDRQTGLLTRLADLPGPGSAWQPVITAGGRAVAFWPAPDAENGIQAVDNAAALHCTLDRRSPRPQPANAQSPAWAAR